MESNLSARGFFFLILSLLLSSFVSTVRAVCANEEDGKVCRCRNVQSGGNTTCEPLEGQSYNEVILEGSPQLEGLLTSAFGADTKAAKYSIAVDNETFFLGERFLGEDDVVVEIVFVAGLGALHDVDEEAFQGLTSLTSVTLSGTQTEDGSGLGMALSAVGATLETLVLSGNRLANFTTTFDAEFGRLETLDLANNSLRSFFCPGPSVRSAMPALVNLGLSFNELEDVPPGLSDVDGEGAGSDLLYLDLSHNSISTLRTGDLRNLQFAKEIRLDSNPIRYFESASLYLDGYWDFVRQPLRIDLSENAVDANFAVDAFGEMDRGFIAELDVTNTSLTTLPREPFYEFLVTSLERPYEEGFEFLSDTPLQILTNNTDFFCCSLDWLFVEGRRRGAEFQAQVPEISCHFEPKEEGEDSSEDCSDGGILDGDCEGEDGEEDQVPEGGTLWLNPPDGPTCEDFADMCVEGGEEAQEEWREECLDAINESSAGGDDGGDGDTGRAPARGTHDGLLTLILVASGTAMGIP